MFEKRLKRETPVNDRLIVCITGDIDDFYLETIDCLECYFSVLKKNRIQAELFITAKAAEEYPERVEYIVKQQHVIGGHGDIHRGFHQSKSIQMERMKTMMKTFSHNFGLDIEGFRAPLHCHNKNTYYAVEKAGLKYDCSKKRFEIVFKRIPFFEKRYMDTKSYSRVKPFLKIIASAYNRYNNSPPFPYYITPKVLEFPTQGITDYALVVDPQGPRFFPDESSKIGDIWTECLIELKQRGGGVMTLQAHPGRLSPAYVASLDYFIQNALRLGAVFSTPNEICHRFPGSVQQKFRGDG
ncbi:polysaccharide deacetylase family protein [Methanosphaerula subterraneus]|uniref:polysaccharide deacetylase family protein n=1 Tax=Methanosphaerula subterraneus TaxID=3350244 RepID=UPI003F837B72